MDGQLSGWMDGQMDIDIYGCIFIYTLDLLLWRSLANTECGHSLTSRSAHRRESSVVGAKGQQRLCGVGRASPALTSQLGPIWGHLIKLSVCLQH
jgi:hypothetical protein